MRTNCQSNHKIHYANYYAVELLEAYFGKSYPEEKEIFALENQLKNHSYSDSLNLQQNRKVIPKALIISSDSVEQNILTLMLHTNDIAVEHIRSKRDLFDFFAQKKRHEIVIVSDKFKDVGINFLSIYFQSMKHKPYLIYLGDDSDVNYRYLGFDAQLKHPFFTKDLIEILPKAERFI